MVLVEAGYRLRIFADASSNVPIAITLGAAVITALVAIANSWMNARQQRDQNLRQRRTDAASEFAKSVHMTTALILDAVRGEDSKAEPRVPPSLATKALHQLHVAESDCSHVELLFADTGPDPDPTHLAKATRQCLQEANKALTTPKTTKGDIRELIKAAECQLDSFVSAAAKVVKR